MISRQEDVDFILYKVMKGRPLTQIQKEFILEEFVEGEPLIINGNMLFKIIKNDGEVVVLKPIGSNIFSKDVFDYKKETITRRYIDNDKIVETVL